jgi:mono/diheme cytochrome c family protein
MKLGQQNRNLNLITPTLFNMKKKSFTVITILVGSFVLSSMTTMKLNQQDYWKVPEEYQNMENPYADTKDDEKIGRAIYSKHCKLCHGSKGLGDGPGSELLETPVANFTLPTFKNQSDGSVYYKIYTGRINMPGFEKIITEDEDMWMVVKYIKSL